MGSFLLSPTSALASSTPPFISDPRAVCVLSLQPAPRAAAPRLRSKEFNGRSLVCVSNTEACVAASMQHRRPLPPSAALVGEPATTPVTVKEVPGDEGPPLLVSVRDRSTFWNKGPDAFFSGLIQKFGSTVLRVTMPPGLPFFPPSQTIMLLDQKSYPVLFDMSKVSKKDVFTGTYVPSWDYTGGFRVLSYLDPSEKKHELLKNFCFDTLRSTAGNVVPEFRKAFNEACVDWEEQMAKKGKAEFVSVCQDFSFNFLCRSILGRDPATPGEASLGSKGPTHIQAWVGLQLFPQLSIGLPKLVEFFLHTVPLPYALVASQYNKLYKFFWTYSKELLDMAATKYGLDRNEACHNLLFYICFNTWGGIQALYPSIVYRIAEAGPAFQAELAAEVRKAVQASGGLTIAAIESMELVHSTVYEVLRIDPPVPFQYARAKDDLVIESHDAAYKVKKGELIGGYLGIAMKDPKVFEAPDEFRPKRFMGEEGEKLVQYVLWSNGRETEDTAVGNKQCAGKNYVIFIARLFVAELFLRYNTMKIGPTTAKGLTKVFSFTSLEKKAGP